MVMALPLRRKRFMEKIIVSIHGKDGGLTMNSSSPYKSGPWYQIMKLKDDISSHGITLPSIFKIKIGNGRTTRFWTDPWLGGPRLCDTFPRLYRLESNLECLVFGCAPMPHSNGTSAFVSPCTWCKHQNPRARFLKPIFGCAPMPHSNGTSAFVSSHVHGANIKILGPGSLTPVSHLQPPGLMFLWAWTRQPRSVVENQELLELTNLLSSLCLSNDIETWECSVSNDRLFTVKSMRKYISSLHYTSNPPTYRWNNALPIKIDISSWMIFLERLPTRANLDRRGFNLKDHRHRNYSHHKHHRAFASGIILATGFMHVLPDSFDMLRSSCLADNPWHKFPFTGFVAMLSAIFTLMVDSMATSMYTKKNNAVSAEGGDEAVTGGDQEIAVTSGGGMHFHGHHHGQKGAIGQQLLRYRVVAMVLELGIVVHSIVIGLGVGASNDVCTIKPLIAALCFHQMFEGMGLGGCILQAEYKTIKKTIMVFFFSTTTPFGIALGIALSKVYKENSPTSLITVGLLNASSAGLLIYMALVDLLAADFMGAKLQGSIKLQLKSYAAVLLGAGGMSLMAKWA
nr:probable zinc transporter 10 [Tanacetum cinerariifolium]